jgi:hypothetical protein
MTFKIDEHEEYKNFEVTGSSFGDLDCHVFLNKWKTQNSSVTITGL